ncbi:MAG: glycoside hydrolase family 11 protein [Candidatus Azobacteroides sp.]|nr:glycoside hydrolase family 11 protein [Candidatus Azobacteroides sp.]
MKKHQIKIGYIPLLVCCLWAACVSNKVQKEKDTDPCIRDTKLVGGTTFTSNSEGNQPLSGSPYGYEMWTEGGNNNRLTWYGANQGGGAAFRAEWNEPNDFLGRIGYFWNQGKPYADYKDVYCDFNYTRSADGSAGHYSYIGIYGWSRNPMVEWYIVDDWFGEGIIGPSTMGNGASKKGEFTMDGGTYFIYEAVRPAGSGNIEGSNEPFSQFFSIRQTRRECGTISITEHFKKWERIGLKLGKNMYDVKFLVEAGGGTGWFDATYISFYMK